MSPVFDRNAIALPDHNLVGRDRRRCLGGLLVCSFRPDVHGNCPGGDSPDNSVAAAPETSTRHGRPAREIAKCHLLLAFLRDWDVTGRPDRGHL
jgi:hypothetical protein